jgi:hypothetical protein
MKLLTKTDFILYRDCAKNVWVKCHKPEEYAKFEISAFEKALGVMGNEVEELARSLFPDGYLIERRSDGAQELTKKLISEHHPVIYQAVFSTDEYLAATDVLKWNDKANAYDIYEIKMSSTDDEDEEETEDVKPKKVNRKKEEQYEYDLAFQTNVAKLCGVTFNKKYLVRLNRNYVRMGRLDLEKLFEITDKTEVINDTFQSIVMTNMIGAIEYLSDPKEPVGNCTCYYTRGRSAHCTSFSISNPDVPEYSVHDLYKIGLSKKYLGELLAEGVLDIAHVPEDDRLKPKKPAKGKEPSKPRKLNQVRVHKSKQPIIDIEGIKRELDSLQFPLYFLDYETYPTAIPPFDGYRPYQHIVFQYSLHILRDKDSKPEHVECIILEGDPSLKIVEGLRKNISNVGTVISWYKKFENSRNRELANLMPRQEDKDFLNNLVERTYDLMDIVNDQYYVHHGFRGSASIKKVQPVIAPDFSYKNLGVQNGTDAIEAYRQISTGELSRKDAENKKHEMLEYCKYDTEIMYIIWKFFTDLINKDGTR